MHHLYANYPIRRYNVEKLRTYHRNYLPIKAFKTASYTIDESSFHSSANMALGSAYFVASAYHLEVN